MHRLRADIRGKMEDVLTSAKSSFLMKSWTTAAEPNSCRAVSACTDGGHNMLVNCRQLLHEISRFLLKSGIMLEDQL